MINDVLQKLETIQAGAIRTLNDSNYRKPNIRIAEQHEMNASFDKEYNTNGSG